MPKNEMLHPEDPVPDERKLESLTSYEAGYYDYVGFPFLLVLYVPSVADFILLPTDASEGELLELGSKQTELNGLDTCLVLSQDQCFYMSPDGRIQPSNFLEPSQILTTGIIRPTSELENTPHTHFRRDALDFYLKELGFDLSTFRNQAIAATPLNERNYTAIPPHLAGGITVGREVCENCGYQKGYGWDPNASVLQVIWISCKCENTNLCASCHKPLGVYGLNSFFYNGPQRAIWYYSGFGAVTHPCERAIDEKILPAHTELEVID